MCRWLEETYGTIQFSRVSEITRWKDHSCAPKSHKVFGVLLEFSFDCIGPRSSRAHSALAFSSTAQDLGARLTRLPSLRMISPMNRIAIDHGERFSLGGENFVITVPVKELRLSTSEAFTIAKNEPYLRVYEDLASAFSPRSILELGIFQGGSYAFLDKLFKPRRMSAVEISPKPVAPLVQYVEDKEGRFVHFSTSQSDRKILEHIVRNELANELDLVVDDASHSYEQTKASFEILFPLLHPSGIYVIEDWSWAHLRNYQSPDAPFSTHHALSNLLFEQLMLMGSTSLISEIRVWPFLYLIRKAKSAFPGPDVGQEGEGGSVFDQILSRGRKWNLV